MQFKYGIDVCTTRATGCESFSSVHSCRVESPRYSLIFYALVYAPPCNRKGLTLPPDSADMAAWLEDVQSSSKNVTAVWIII
jgi:hypothetical protein